MSYDFTLGQEFDAVLEKQPKYIHGESTYFTSTALVAIDREAEWGNLQWRAILTQFVVPVHKEYAELPLARAPVTFLCTLVSQGCNLISQMLPKESLSQLQLYKHHKNLPDYIQLPICVIQRQLKASI